MVIFAWTLFTWQRLDLLSWSINYHTYILDFEGFSFMCYSKVLIKLLNETLRHEILALWKKGLRGCFLIHLFWWRSRDWILEPDSYHSTLSMPLILASGALFHLSIWNPHAHLCVYFVFVFLSKYIHVCYWWKWFDTCL